MNTSTIAHQFKGAVYDAAKALWATTYPSMLVSYGVAVAPVPDDVFMVLGVESNFDPAAISPQRQREETLTLETQFWIFRPGVEDAEREATDFLYARLAELEQHIRVVDTELGGLVRNTKLARHRSDSIEAERAALGGSGRLAVAIAEFEAQARIRSIP
jgi:hypothetical protein